MLLSPCSNSSRDSLQPQDDATFVPMHKIPNIPLGKVANRSIIRVFFPRMYHQFDSNLVSPADLTIIYNRALLPIIRRLMPNQATHWPPSYEIAMQTSRDRGGRLHFGSLDIPHHLLPEFARSYLRSVEDLRPYFRDAYFGHELRGWKAATVHNLEPEEDAEEQPPAVPYERVEALEDLTRVLDISAIHPDQWMVDVGLEFGLRGKVVTWRTHGHKALVRHLVPQLRNPDRTLKANKGFYQDPQMHMKDISGFRWNSAKHSDVFKYIQAYTTEKSISYQLHDGIFRYRKPSELLSHRVCERLLKDLDSQSTILFACTGDREENGQRDDAPQEGCARLEVRVSLRRANEVLTAFPRNLWNQTLVQIPAQYWWSVLFPAFSCQCPHSHLFISNSQVLQMAPSISGI